MGLQIGDLAPDFVLQDSQGKPFALGDLRGCYGVLYFYPRDNTPGCTQEAQGFRDLYDRFQAQNIAIWGISADDAKAHQKFIQKHQLPFPLLCDPGGQVATAYESYGPKKFMGREFIGVYRHTFIIDPLGQIAQIYRKVKPALHAAQVLDDLAALIPPT
jgi:thioredoxin-dependent peroxiredoxin